MSPKFIILTLLAWLHVPFSFTNAQSNVNSDTLFVLSPDTLWFITSEDFITGKDYQVSNPHSFPVSITQLDQFGLPFCNCVGWYSEPYYPAASFPITIPAGGSKTFTVHFFVSDNPLSPLVYDTLNVQSGSFARHLIIAVDSFDILIGHNEQKLSAPAISVYPNPFTGYFTISLVSPEPGPVSISMYNPRNQKFIKILDTLVKEGKNLVKCETPLIAGAKLSSGLFFLSVRQKSGITWLKLIRN